jgi:Transcriptional regulator, contains sigma factor-related N-terminal domain
MDIESNYRKQVGSDIMEPEVYNQSTSIVLKAAYLYYLKDMPQNEIANILNVSVPTVSRLLRKAKEDRIVEFVIRDPYIECIELEEELKNTFNLKDVIIAPNPVISGPESQKSGEHRENIKKLVALEGARYIQRMIKEDDILGITIGGTVYHMIHFLNPCQKVNTEFVTLHGSISCLDNELDVRTLVSRMAMAFGGKKNYLLAEGILSRKDIADSIKSEANIQNVYRMFDKVTVAINGLGSLYPRLDSKLCYSEYLSHGELDELVKKGVVGDIALRFFDSEGNECDTELKNRTISIDLKKFKNIKTKVTIASGDFKAHTVLSAIKGGLMDILITDYSLGKAVLKLAKE